MTVPRPFDWRLPLSVIPLENFDLPGMHEPSEFNADRIASMTMSRTAGCEIRRSPEEIRDMIRTGRLQCDDRAYLGELISQFDCQKIRWFTMHCGISRYEMAKVIIACDI